MTEIAERKCGRERFSGASITEAEHALAGVRAGLRGAIPLCRYSLAASRYAARTRRGRIRLCGPTDSSGHPPLRACVQPEIARNLSGVCGDPAGIRRNAGGNSHRASAGERVRDASRVFSGTAAVQNFGGRYGSSQLCSCLHKRSGAGAGGTRDTFCCTDGPPGPSIFAGGTPIKESGNVFCRRTFDGSGFPDETAGSGVHHLRRTRNIVEGMEGTRGQKEIRSAPRRVRGGSGNSVFTDLRGTLQGRGIWKVLVLDSFLCEPIRYVDGTCAGFAVFSENCAAAFFGCASCVVFRSHRNFRPNQGTRQKRGFELHHQFAGVVVRWRQRGNLIPRSLLYFDASRNLPASGKSNEMAYGRDRTASSV